MSRDHQATGLDVQSINKRIDLLESHSRWWRRATIALMLALVLIVGLGQTRPSPRELDPDRITFRDAAGRVRMELAADRERSPTSDSYSLRFCGEDGKAQASLSMSGNSPSLMMQGSELDALRNSAKRAAVGEKPTFDELEKRQGKTLIILSPSGMLEGLTVANTAFEGCAASLDTSGLYVRNLDMKPATESWVKSGSIIVRGGCITVGDAKGGEAAAKLGPVELEEPKTGAKVICPPGTLTLIDSKGKVMERLPR